MQIIGVQGTIISSAVGELIFSVLLYGVVKASYKKPLIDLLPRVKFMTKVRSDAGILWRTNYVIKKQS